MEYGKESSYIFRSDAALTLDGLPCSYGILGATFLPPLSLSSLKPTLNQGIPSFPRARSRASTSISSGFFSVSFARLGIALSGILYSSINF